MDGDHTIERSFEVTSRTLHAVFTELRDQRVDPEGMLLKPNMVLSGYSCPQQASHDEVAEQTLRCFRRHVPAAVPGNRVPVGRPVGRGRDREPERDQRAAARTRGSCRSRTAARSRRPR